MRVLVFGASTTQGYWDTKGGWATRLRRHYDQKQAVAQAAGTNNGGMPSIFNLGVSADNTNDILKRFEHETIARQRPGMAFIFSVGGNDGAVENSKKRLTEENFKSNVEKLIKLARKYSEKMLFVGLNPVDESRTTPVFWANVHYTNDAIMTNNETVREVCEKQDIPFVSVFEKLEEAARSGEGLLVDGLHPNDRGHELIYEIVRPELDKLLNL